MALGLELLHLLHRPDLALLVRDDAFPFHLEHGETVERDVRTGPGIWCRGEIVCVGLTRDLEDGHGDLLSDLWPD